MKNSNYMKFVICLTFPFVLLSCASTTVTGTWRDVNYNTPIENVLVIGIARNKSTRRIFESTLSDDIISTGKKAVVSATLFEDSAKINEQTLAPVIKKEKFNKVIMARVVSVDRNQTFIPSSYPGHYRSMYGYYGHARTSFGGHNIRNKIVSLEINMYETKTNNLIWAITTEVFEPGNMNREIQAISKIIINELKKEKLL